MCVSVELVIAWVECICIISAFSFHLSTSYKLTDWRIDHSECVQSERCYVCSARQKQISTEETIVGEGRTIWLCLIFTIVWCAHHSHQQHCTGWESTCWTLWALCVRRWYGIWLILCAVCIGVCVVWRWGFSRTKSLRGWVMRERVVHLPSYAEIVVYSSPSLRFHYLCVSVMDVWMCSLSPECNLAAGEGMGVRCLRGCGALWARWWCALVEDSVELRSPV